MGGWGIVAADILVMPSLAQVAGQYLFLLFGANGIGSQANSGWVLLIGILWIVAMTVICYVGIEISANFQKILLGIELTMLLLLSAVALVKVGKWHRAARDTSRPRGPGSTPLSGFVLCLRGRPHTDALHLLGLGHLGIGQRGNRATSTW